MPVLLPLLLTLVLCPVRAADFPELYNTEKEDSRPMSPEETVKTAVLPPGFHLEVFASEPEVQQPIGITFDEKGRLWVAECYTFAETPLRWDMKLQDRVIVLEDTDGDGRSDKRTVFWDQGKRLTSIAVGNGGIWVTCAPQLLFIPDANGDLVPDGDPIVMLDGFDAETIGHNIVNGLKFGPDGWLYGRHGITSTSLVGRPGTPANERQALNCAIWRFHPVSKQFEVFCHGGTNPWGMDWNEGGQLFYTNTVIGHLWHAIPGAYYERMFGAHLNPLAYEVIGHTADHYHWDRGTEKWSDIRKGISDKTSDLGGGHAHMGCLIYQGGLWPAEYQGKLFTCNLHGRRINMDILEREGNGYVGRHGKDFMMLQDPWFRGLDLITGPDGQVWMNDWSDTGECHDNDGIHRTSGRIYRIVYDGPDKGTPTPKRPAWLTRRAEGPLSLGEIGELLASTDEAKRAMGVRWLSEDKGEEEARGALFLHTATNKPSSLVRLELAAALQRVPSELRFEIASSLCERAEDQDDRQQSLMIWYGIAESVTEDSGKAVNLATQSKLPKVTQWITRRLAENLEKASGPLNDLLSRATPENRLPILRGLNEALKGWSKASKPAAWDGIVKAGGNEEVETLLRELSLVFGDGRAREALLKIAGDAEGDAGARRAALVNLLRQPDDALLPLLKEWVNDRIISREAILGLASYEEKGVPQLVLNHWQRNPLNRTAAINTLVSRPSYAVALLKSLEKGELPRSAISPFQARQIQSFGDAKLNEQLRATWGDLHEAPEATKAEIAQWKQSLTPEVIAQSDSARGKVVFTQTCAACHKLYGEGGAIGPDLTGSDRHNLDYLLGNIVNPNEIVPADYRLTLFTLKDGRILSGVIPEQNERSVTVQSPAERIVIDAKDITKRETLPVSLMPEGLLKSLSESDAHALISYLMSKDPLSEK
ncbi:MAG: c-type cytochrome [Verrucomicrobiales bacterium]|nr:c-type cytochrome [Verrucomicrobiales bacterium]MBP9225868.1 c-type cytochrome [Verrucomicrobiales bacterium]